MNELLIINKILLNFYGQTNLQYLTELDEVCEPVY